MVNKKEAHIKTNKLKDFIKFNSLSGSKINLFQYCQNNGKDHEEYKWKVFKRLIHNDWKVLVEPELKKGGRPDFIAFKDSRGIIIEIVDSESEESINKKAIEYPMEFDLEIVRCSQPLNKQLEFL